MVAVGVGNEYLTVGVARYQFHNALHSQGIEFVEYVVEQQQWGSGVGCFAQEVKLRQFQ